jgi:uncharacterized protein
VANRLAQETSAYLLQHRDNPVDWYPWGPEAFALAARTDRPVLVSIGYSSCHWCHVMEHESFEDPETAQLMNQLVVSIKVDREERPDVDQIYMDTVVRLTGQGGWPLNVFCTPDGRPFFGGTYFPPQRAHGRPSWRDVVVGIARLWREERARVESEAGKIFQVVTAKPDLGQAPRPGRAGLSAFGQALMRNADARFGGFGTAPKFPTPTNLEALLLGDALGAGTAGAVEHVVYTLQRMARGGIYDQLGGGFHRYSTDAHWLVPHFEKMLYDQGQLLRVYAEAFRQSGNADLEWPVAETAAYLERELRSPEGGFFASQDADSEGEEGRFYVWDRADVEDVLGPEEAAAFCDAYAVTPTGTFEHTGKSVLEHVLAGERPRFATERQALLAARGVRIAPATDHKQVASWIAYTIGGLARCGAAFERPDWVAAAARAADFALEYLVSPAGELRRVFDSAGARIPAFLDDHAALCAALLDLHAAGAQDSYAAAAFQLADTIVERFYDAASRELFFAPPGDANLIYRPASDHDGATPGAAGLAVLSLVRCAALSGRADLRAVAESVLDAQAAFATRVPIAHPTLLRAAALLEFGLGVGIVLGPPDDPRTGALAARCRRLLGPEDAVVVWDPATPPPAWLAPSWLQGRTLRDGAPTAYLCRGTVCSLPAQKPDELVLP